MKYLQSYDINHDDHFQVELEDDYQLPAGVVVRLGTPFEGIPIKSRFSSERYEAKR